MDITEAEMRAALGIDSPKPSSKPKTGYIKHQLKLKYSVRKPSGGAVTTFTYVHDGISELEGKLAAEKEISRQGLVVWALLEISKN